MAETQSLADLQAELVKIGESMHLDKAEMQIFVKESMDREAKMRSLELKATTAAGPVAVRAHSDHQPGN